MPAALTRPPASATALPPTLASSLRAAVATMRPRQWVKNLFVLAPLVFARRMFDGELALRALLAFFAFCFVASAVYTINDLVDLESDRAHPIKRSRPIAAGLLPPRAALALAASLVGTAALLSWARSPVFSATVAGYVVLNLGYTLGWKRIAYLDVACIALGFILRIIAGAIAVGCALSIYLVACTALLALFLGFGKRRHELAAVDGTRQRHALAHYRTATLDGWIFVTGAASVLTYLAYALDGDTARMFHTRLLWLTTPFAVFGVLRFVSLVRHRLGAESPTQEMLTDWPFLLNLGLWALATVWMVYGGAS